MAFVTPAEHTLPEVALQGPEQEAEDSPEELPKRPNTTQAKHEQNVRNNRAHYWYMEDEPPFSHVPAGHRTQLDRTPEPAW